MWRSTTACFCRSGKTESAAFRASARCACVSFATAVCQVVCGLRNAVDIYLRAGLAQSVVAQIGRDPVRPSEHLRFALPPVGCDFPKTQHSFLHDIFGFRAVVQDPRRIGQKTGGERSAISDLPRCRLWRRPQKRLVRRFLWQRLYFSLGLHLQPEVSPDAPLGNPAGLGLIMVATAMALAAHPLFQIGKFFFADATGPIGIKLFDHAGMQSALTGTCQRVLSK